MIHKTHAFIPVLFLTAGFTGGCSPADREIVDEMTGKGNCAFSVPRKMRALQKIYNEDFSAPDSEGNSQSRETCENGLDATAAYRNGLLELEIFMDESCALSKAVDDARRQIQRTDRNLLRHLEETDCASLYGDD